jgi:hypothetical protein
VVAHPEASAAVALLVGRVRIRGSSDGRPDGFEKHRFALSHLGGKAKPVGRIGSFEESLPLGKIER